MTSRLTLLLLNLLQLCDIILKSQDVLQRLALES
jgi:hypothetical protein